MARLLDPRWLKIARDAWLHKTRTVLAVVAIAIGLCAAAIVLNAWALVRRATVEQYAASNPAAMTLTVDSVDRPLLDLVRTLPGVAAARRRRVIAVNVRGATGSSGGSLVALDDFTGREVGALSLESGRWPDSDSAIVIERSSVDMLDAAVGGTVDVRATNGDQARFVVSGIARDVGIPPGWMDHTATAFVHPKALARVGKEDRFDQLQLTLAGNPRDIGVVRRMSRDVALAIQRAGHEVADIDVPQPGRHPHAAQMDSLLFTQGAFGALALALSAFLVVNLIGAMIAAQTREIGIMKAIGGRRGQIAALYLVLAAALGFAAIILALPFAAWAGRAYAGFVSQMLNFDVSHVAIPRWILATEVIAGIGLPVLAAAVPVIRGCRMSVCVALRGSTLAAAGIVAREPRWMQTDALPRPVLLAARMLIRRPVRAALTIVTLAVGGGVFLGARSLRRGVLDSVDASYAAFQFDAALRFAEAHAVDSLESAARSVGGLRGAEAWLRTNGTVTFADGSVGNVFPITGLPATTSMLSPRLLDGRWLTPADGHALVVSRRLAADQPALATGATVMLLVNGKSEPWTVVGVVEAGIDAGAYATRDEVARSTGDATSSRLMIAGVDSSHAGRLALIRRARETLAAAGLDVSAAQVADDGRAAIEDHLVMVVWFLGAMAQVMIVVGGLGLASTMSIGVMERTREIGVLRAIGATPGAVQALVHTEGLCIASLSWLLAVILSIPIGLGLGAVFGRMMLPVPMKLLPGAMSIFEWLAATAAISVVASLWPARRASAVPVRDALAYE